jgi:hypothetical protein
MSYHSRSMDDQSPREITFEEDAKNNIIIQGDNNSVIIYNRHSWIKQKFSELCNFFNAQFSDSNGRNIKIYGGDSGKPFEDYWKDYLGASYAFEKSMRNFNLHDELIFEDIVLTNWVPFAPGLFYTKHIWDDHPNNFRYLFRDVRFNEYNGKRICSIHSIKDFVAHADISKGIPIVLDVSCYELLEKDILKYGAVHIDEVKAVLSMVPKKLEPRVVEGSPDLVPVSRYESDIGSLTPSDPLIASAWTVSMSLKDKEKPVFISDKFWVGCEKWEESLNKACENIRRMVKERNGIAIYRFDEEKKWFDAIYGPKDFIEFEKDYIKKNYLLRRDSY